MSKEKIIKFIKETSDPVWLDDSRILEMNDFLDIVKEFAESQLTQANERIKELEEENENKKCCGNCKYLHTLICHNKKSVYYGMIIPLDEVCKEHTTKERVL